MDTEVATDIVGWISTLILTITISAQVWQQWRSKSVAGVSHWLFIGQLSASLGYTIYSFALHNWVFVVSNTFLFLTAVLGQFLFLRNQRRQARMARHSS
jgi:MtN3 and saliva related transmembrane protein